jgi:hypothetical protein
LVVKIPWSKWEARALESSLINIWEERMLVQSCNLASLIVILMRLAKELAREARFWFMMMCMPFKGIAADMLDTAVASTPMSPLMGGTTLA